MSLYSTEHINFISPRPPIEDQLSLCDETGAAIPLDEKPPHPLRPVEIGDDEISLMPDPPFQTMLQYLDKPACKNLRLASRFLNKKIQAFPRFYPFYRILKIRYTMYDMCHVFTAEDKCHLIEFPQHCLLNNHISEFQICDCVVTKEWLEWELIPAFKESSCVLDHLVFKRVELRITQDLLNEFLLATKARKVTFDSIRQTRWVMQAALYDMKWINQVNSLSIQGCDFHATMRPDQIEKFKMTKMDFATVDGITWEPVMKIIEEWFDGRRDILSIQFHKLESDIPSFFPTAFKLRRFDDQHLLVAQTPMSKALNIRLSVNNLPRSNAPVITQIPWRR